MKRVEEGLCNCSDSESQQVKYFPASAARELRVGLTLAPQVSRVREPKALAYAAIRFSVQSSGPRGTNPNLSVTSSLIPEKHDSGRDAYKDHAGASYFRVEHSLMHETW